MEDNLVNTDLVIKKKRMLPLELHDITGIPVKIGTVSSEYKYQFFRIFQSFPVTSVWK